MKLLLFDIDGTMVKGSGMGSRLLQRAGESLFGREFNTKNLNTAGKIDPQILEELKIINPTLDLEKHRHAFKKRYLKELELELEHPPENYVLKGVHDLISALLRQKVTLGLLTGNYASAANLKLKAGGFQTQHFEITAFSDDAITRNDLPPNAINNYQQNKRIEIHPAEVMIIGDTPRDIECAKVNGCHAFAVATGSFSYEQLQASGADTVAHDFQDSSLLLDLLV